MDSNKVAQYCLHSVLSTNLHSLGRIRHEELPGLTRTLWDPNARKDPYLDVGSLLCTPELPIFASSKTVRHIDPVTNVVDEKLEWVAEMNLKLRYLLKNKMTHVKKRRIGTELDVPSYVFQMDAMLKQDPEEYFSNAVTYNWFHTNGTLNLLKSINDTNDRLFCTSGKNHNRLNLLEIHPEKAHIKLSKVHYIKYPFRIFEVDSYQVATDTLVCLRGRTCFEIKRLIDRDDIDEKFDFVTIQSYVNDTQLPIVSATTNQCDQYAVIDVKNSLKIFDIHTNQCVQEFSDTNSEHIDCWSSIKYARSLNKPILYVDRHTFGLFDSRVNLFNRTIAIEDTYIEHSKLPLHNELGIYACDKFSFLQPSLATDHHVYLGTYHTLLTADLRMPGRILKKWTHMMKSAPTYCKPFQYHETEHVYFASQLFGEKMLANTCPREHTPPFLLKSFNDTLLEAKLRGNCLNPLAIVNELPTFATNGLEIVDNTHFLSSTSRGDVFATSLHTKNDDEDDFNRAIKSLDINYGIVSQQNRGKCLNVTSVGLTRYHAPSFRPRANVNEVISQRISPQMRHYSWKRSVDDLAACEDVLAGHLLEQWGLTTQTQMDRGTFGNAGAARVDDPSTRVNSWLMTSQINENINQVLGRQMSQSQTIETAARTTSFERMMEERSLSSSSIGVKFSQKRLAPQTPPNLDVVKKKVKVAGF